MSNSFFSGSYLPKLQNNIVPGKNLFNIIKSAFVEHEGPNHCWVNNVDIARNLYSQDNTFLVLANACIQDVCLGDYYNRSLLIQIIRGVQKRYPKLNIVGVQCVGSVKSAATHFDVIKAIMKEYITFPVLLLDKKLIKEIDPAVYLFVEGSYIKTEADVGSILKVIDELDFFQKDNTLEKSNVFRNNQHEIVKEPFAGSSFRNLLLCYAGSLSVDEDRGHIFLSDSNHHRIIIADGDGKIVDCIGSSPGFVDSDFESAKLLRPAASFFNISDGCLYFVDSENNAIRRADMERRLVETMYPVPKSTTIWGQILHVWDWILNISRLSKECTKPGKFDLDSLDSPWHLLQLGDDEFVIISLSFGTAWVMNMKTWKIKEVIRGFPNIFENYGHLIMEKLSLLKDAYGVSPQKFSSSNSPEKSSYAGQMSSVGNLQNDVIFSDSVGQSLFKYNRESMSVSNINFSNLGVLGVPYWLNCPIEIVFNSSHFTQSIHVYNFSVLPGRCRIQINVEIPKDTELAAPLDENCVWRQARGSAAEISGSVEEITDREKVGVAQQWFDELDNLAFSNSGLEPNGEVDDKSMDQSFQDIGKAHFFCDINVSPGTSEVIVSAALYLRANSSLNYKEVASKLGSQENEKGKLETECISLLLEECGQSSGIIFTKPLYLRIKLVCGDHPTAATSKETILTDTILEVNVAMDYQ